MRRSFHANKSFAVNSRDIIYKLPLEFHGQFYGGHVKLINRNRTMLANDNEVNYVLNITLAITASRLVTHSNDINITRCIIAARE